MLSSRTAARPSTPLVVVTLLALAACSGGSGSGSPSGTPSGTPAGSSGTPSGATSGGSPSVTRTTPGTVAGAADRLPLTGLAAKAGVPRRPALVVKVENSTAARPQTGLGAADLVVEELVEGGITRFAAMYQSRDPGVIGPVRSVRNVDAQIAAPTRGILAFSGGAKVVLAVVRTADVQLVQPGDAAGAFFRSSSRRAPHNLYLRAAKVWAVAGSEHAAPPAAYLPFAAAADGDAATGGDPVKRAVLRFSAAARPGWTYDAGTKRWLRSEGARAAVGADGKRLVADSVLVLRVRVGEAGYKDPAGNPVPETVFTGSGDATLLQAGRAVQGRWAKKGSDGALTLTAADGSPLLVPPGRTWVELLPVGSGLKLS